MPGKLNLSEFHKVTSALSGMQVGGPQVSTRGGAPLAASEDYDQHGYAVPRDNVQVQKQAFAYSHVHSQVFTVFLTSFASGQ